MKIQLQVLAICFILYACNTSKQAPQTKYFDANYQQITQPEFNRSLSSNHFLEEPGDSVNHRKLITREKRGTVNNKAEIEHLLREVTKNQVASEKPIIVVYYPGKDDCNKNISLNKTSVRSMEKELFEEAELKPIYLYKEDKGLKRYAGFLQWHQDPKQFFERTFFQHAYPCSSFVVIAANGSYISYLGEFNTQKIKEALAALRKT
ncbi:hypothetical protein [Roseivirga pacifica]|uniref:hypothetical protein n=1 Tax=Roseivirga pacifica TaxID=1267423 RepID=UPI0020946EE5|nr:hypothetical protein [Roseivirga pacifica]MCO6357590.1 hypothetical protein [Roseivirga pacifica]MCO6365843.1 hypothetical protein [Roseivirga pacifica]MCO6371172.1 hypothetical protein [Roseivirga pacifica]MCO6375657.1 hypothetical protein [Roseivirga pacifica]MCO6378550.1 hypothetical protein [Roseivirga pacifica]